MIINITFLFQAELLEKKYQEKYKQVSEIHSKLTIEDASFREVQVKFPMDPTALLHFTN